MKNEKILAVDDDAMNLAIMEELLSEEYDLSTARSGEQALVVAEKVRPDLVLLDIMMPGIDGYETCRRMRERECLRHTKVVLVSAKAMLSERLKGYDAGADDYITKPFDHAEISAKIKVFLRLKFMEEMNALKTEFLVLMAHETRTPLTKLLLMAEMLDEEMPVREDERRRITRMLRETSEQLRSLFDRGHRYCTLRAGRGKCRRTTFDAARILQETAAGLAEKASLLNVRLGIGGLGAAEVESDQEHVELVMNLLLESVLARSGRDATVFAELSTREDGVVLRVRGPSQMTDPADLRLLCEPFRSPDLRHHSSTGCLDLPLAGEVMRMLQGELSLSLLPGNELLMEAHFPISVDARSPEWADEEPEDERAAA